MITPLEALNLRRDFENWIITHPSVKDSSKRNYLYNFDKILPEFIENSLQFTAKGWDEFCNLQRDRLSNSTLNSYLASLKKFGEFLLETRNMEYNLFERFKGFKKPEKITLELKYGEAKKFLNEIAKDRNSKLMITLLYSLDITLEELLNLELEHFDCENKVVLVNNKKLPISKNIIKLLPPRMTPLVEGMETHTRVIRTSRGALSDKRSIQRIVKDISEKADLEVNITPRIVQNMPEILASSGSDYEQITEILGTLPDDRIGKVLEYLIRDGKHKEVVKFIKPIVSKKQIKNYLEEEIPISILKGLISEDVMDSVIEILELEEKIPLSDLPEVLEFASSQEAEVKSRDDLVDREEYFEKTQLKVPDDLEQRLKSLKDNLEIAIDMSKLIEIASALIEGDVILSGPPGTGKTVIACNIANVFFSDTDILEKTSRYCKVVTATSDWTTHETIGGLMLGKDKGIERYDGIILQAIKTARDRSPHGKSYWLIIDEINRADINKAFGGMYTAIESGIISHPYAEFLDKDGLKISSDLLIPSSFRIIGTMNTFDKDSLMPLSYGLQRRFSTIHFDLPNEDEEKNIVDKKLLHSLKHISNISGVIDNQEYQKAKDIIFEYIRKVRSKEKVGIEIGTALVLSTLNQLAVSLAYFSEDKMEEYIQQAIIQNICPQFEGVLEEKYDDAIEITREMGFNMVKEHLERQRRRTLGI